ncbi:maleylacetoacetate isomerase [Burkholderia stagnalis]
MKLFHFSRSSASLRVRIALAYKHLEYERERVSLALSEHLSAAHHARHPQNLVPALQLDDGRILVQSLPIIEYLDECYPSPRLLPVEPYRRYYVRAVAQMIACEMHPLNNMRTIRRLRDPLGVDPARVETEWIPHWLATGFSAVESFLTREALHGDFCDGDKFSLADICVHAQVASARRLGFSIEPYPVLAGISDRCGAMDAVVRAQVSVE